MARTTYATTLNSVAHSPAEAAAAFMLAISSGSMTTSHQLQKYARQPWHHHSSLLQVPAL
ncbi:MAG TPA: hypothetical protein VM328_05635 [Fimbriimonadaceae bacterium]|nr:hypothetical protein [Fimbriimonadaceae bacterium]